MPAVSWRILIVALLCLASGVSQTRGDGKYHYRPTDRPGVKEPFQRALILHDGSKEFLLIQPSALGHDGEFGWLVAVPSVPAVGSLKREHADELFESLLHSTRPHTIHLAPLLTLVGLAGCFSYSIILRCEEDGYLAPCGSGSRASF